MNKRVEYYERTIEQIKPNNKTDFSEEIYVMASFNDWLPMRMKTMRRLLMERYPIDFFEGDIPKQCYSADNTNHTYAHMVPPG